MPAEAFPFRTLQEQPPVDELTGLPNRAGLTQELERQTERYPGKFALLFIDLDDFKQLNDRKGHQAGNLALQTTATTLEENTPPVDSRSVVRVDNTAYSKFQRTVTSTLRGVVRVNTSDVHAERRGGQQREDYLSRGAFRFAGDEFVVILAGADTPEKVDKAQTRIESALLKNHIRASVGGRVHRPGESGMDLLDTVDRMMLEKKEARKQQEIDTLPLLKRLVHKICARGIKFSGVDLSR